MVGVVGVLTVTAVGALCAEQPLTSVTVTRNVPAAFTVIDCVVAPLVQRYELPALEVSVVEPPAQNDVAPLMVGVAGVLTVTAVGALCAEQPFASVTVTRNVPALFTV